MPEDHNMKINILKRNFEILERLIRIKLLNSRTKWMEFEEEEEEIEIEDEEDYFLES
jgi:hypothetical protein